MIESIKDSDIEAAALIADVDAALLPLMDIAGITTGDVAAQVFSGAGGRGAAGIIEAKARTSGHPTSLHLQDCVPGFS